MHVDAAQAINKIPVNLSELPVDLMSFSAHKAYGPKGIGALYVRRDPRIHLEPQIHGAGHEFGLRAGTIPTHQIVGMGEAFALAAQELDVNVARIAKLRDKLWHGIQELGDVYLNGDAEKRVVHNLNVSFSGIRGPDLIPSLSDLAVSPGSACLTLNIEPSHVLRALGLKDSLIFSTVRFSLGNYTREEEIDYAISHIKDVVTKLRGK